MHEVRHPIEVSAFASLFDGCSTRTAHDKPEALSRQRPDRDAESSPVSPIAHRATLNRMINAAVGYDAAIAHYR